MRKVMHPRGHDCYRLSLKWDKNRYRFVNRFRQMTDEMVETVDLNVAFSSTIPAAHSSEDVCASGVSESPPASDRDAFIGRVGPTGVTVRKCRRSLAVSFK